MLAGYSKTDALRRNDYSTTSYYIDYITEATLEEIKYWEGDLDIPGAAQKLLEEIEPNPSGWYLSAFELNMNQNMDQIKQTIDFIEELINLSSQYSDDFIDLCDVRSSLKSILERRQNAASK